MDDTPWLTDDEQLTWRRWLALDAQLHALLHRELQRDSDLSLPDFDVLVQLTDDERGRLRIAQLAEALQWERSRLSHHVTRMARRGLVEKEECADDGRGSFVVLTDAGRAAIERAAPSHVRTVRRVFFDAMTSEEAAVLGDLAARVLARIDGPLAQPGVLRKNVVTT